MGEEIQVYPKAVVFCPRNQTEQDMNLCANCENYAGFDINDGEGTAAQFYLGCVK